MILVVFAAPTVRRPASLHPWPSDSYAKVPCHVKVWRAMRFVTLGLMTTDLASIPGFPQAYLHLRSAQNPGPYPKMKGMWAIILGASEVQV